MSNTSKLLIASAIIIVFALSFGAGYFVHSQLPPDYPEGLDTVAEVWDIIGEEYVDPSRFDTDNLSRAAIEGMIDLLDDPYTSFLDDNGYELFSSRLAGGFEGIGAYVTMDDDRLMIIAPIAGSPAEAAGIRAGDIILEIDGEPVNGMSLAEAIMLIRGPEGTNVTLLVLHEDETEPVTIDIIRAKIEVPSIILEWEGDIAHLTITQFDERTAEDLTPVIREINESGARGIVLDLRDNPGGLLDTVVEVASHFIPEGVIVEVESSIGTIATYKAEEVGAVTDMPMIVLVNEFSASGSEVLAGALQDYGRAHIAGTVTFGKGSVNNLYELRDGSGLY
ncbi:MAG: S41 family peptidase, partial [Dehalococcoidales bacterium]|nr:S41 family peptidase [Dehalococcoidales bacterium]